MGLIASSNICVVQILTVSTTTWRTSDLPDSKHLPCDHVLSRCVNAPAKAGGRSSEPLQEDAVGSPVPAAQSLAFIVTAATLTGWSGYDRPRGGSQVTQE